MYTAKTERTGVRENGTRVCGFTVNLDGSVNMF